MYVPAAALGFTPTVPVAGSKVNSGGTVSPGASVKMTLPEPAGFPFTVSPSKTLSTAGSPESPSTPVSVSSPAIIAANTVSESDALSFADTGSTAPEGTATDAVLSAVCAKAVDDTPSMAKGIALASIPVEGTKLRAVKFDVRFMTSLPDKKR